MEEPHHVDNNNRHPFSGYSPLSSRLQENSKHPYSSVINPPGESAWERGMTPPRSGTQIEPKMDFVSLAHLLTDPPNQPGRFRTS